jgi:hypothetical protein
MKRFLQIALILVFLPSPGWAGDFDCRVSNGIYIPPGIVRLDDVSKRDPSVIGQVFYIKRGTGVISGNSLFANTNDEIRILRDVQDSTNTYEVMSTSKHSDVKILQIDKLQGKTTFKYYFGWFGLLLIGECNGA